MGRKKWVVEESEREERRERKMRKEERLIYKIYGNWIVGFHRSKRHGAKDKVDPSIASYTWVPKSYNFVKLYEV